MRPPSQRRLLGVLFAFLALGFAGIGAAAGRADRWVIAAASVAIGLWMAGLAASALRK